MRDLVDNCSLSRVMWEPTGGFCTEGSNDELAKIFSRLFLAVSRVEERRRPVIVTRAIISHSSYFYGL